MENEENQDISNELEEWTFPKEYSNEEIRMKIETNKTENDPRITCRHSATIKEGQRTCQIATCLEIIDEHTGEFHHYEIEIYNIQHYTHKDSIIKEKYRINNLDTFNHLQEFFTLIKEKKLGQETQKHLLVSEKEYELFQKLKDVDDSTVQDVLENPDTYNKLLELGGNDLLKDILQVSLKPSNTVDLIQKLKELDVAELIKLNSLAGLGQLKNILDTWNNNKTKDDEKFWQKQLKENYWVISQLFSYPAMLILDEAYIGGKSIDNTSGKVVDFIYKNNLTQNIILVEIKKPTTKLIGGQYRDSIYSISPALSGSISQSLQYKQQLNRSYSELRLAAMDKGTEKFEAFNPKCILIIGNFENELANEKGKKETFELFRGNSREIEIITFDELFKKVEVLISLLEGV